MDGDRSVVVLVGHRHCTFQQGLPARFGGIALVAGDYILMGHAQPAKGDAL
jgi:hypothetical protein